MDMSRIFRVSMVLSTVGAFSVHESDAGTLCLGGTDFLPKIVSLSSETEDHSEKSIEDVRLLCAVNCLELIAHYHEIEISRDELIELLDPGPLGVTMLRLKEVSEAIGLETMAVELNGPAAFSLHHPFIVWYSPAGGENDELGHFVVIAPIPEEEGVWLFDPPRQKRWISIDEMEHDFRGALPVLLFRRSS